MTVRKSRQKKVMVLLSGGIDSSACIAYYLSQRFLVTALFVNYGQKSAKREVRAARLISKAYRVPLKVIKLSGGKSWGGGCILGRNAFLLYAGLMNFKHENGLIAIGVHSSTTYWDCSEEFIKKIQDSFESYSKGCISVDAPFLKWNKKEIWNFCIKEKVPLEYTYSCELGKEQPCGQCLSCKDLEALNAQSLTKKSI
jgi:7-cyano-7-deazaguanine synthase